MNTALATLGAVVPFDAEHTAQRTHDAALRTARTAQADQARASSSTLQPLLAEPVSLRGRGGVVVALIY